MAEARVVGARESDDEFAGALDHPREWDAEAPEDLGRDEQLLVPQQLGASLEELLRRKKARDRLLKTLSVCRRDRVPVPDQVSREAARGDRECSHPPRSVGPFFRPCPSSG